MAKHRILLVEPSPVVARGLREILKEGPEFELTGSVADLTHCYEKLPGLSPDLILVNPAIFDYARRLSIRTSYPHLRDTTLVAILYGPFEEEVLRQFDGAIRLFDDTPQIIRTLRHALETHHAMPESPESYDLSEREKEILVSVAQGLTNKEIADRHNISIHTVISHRKNISRKTGIKTVSGLTIYAVLNNLIDISDTGQERL